MKPLTILVSLLFAGSAAMDRARACTAFAADTADGRIVGKNFDWYSGDGLVAVNPKGASRFALYSSDTAPFTWTSKWGSVSFSPAGPGFPLSGMNEAGLTVEGLSHLDAEEETRASEGLTAPEWAMYVLDNFATVEEVFAFASKTAYLQYPLALHFLVCDAKGECLVIEKRGRGLDILSDRVMGVNVLANRSWPKDRRALDAPRPKASLFERFLSLLGQARAPGSSAERFRALAFEVSAKAARREAIGFDSLDQSRIAGMTKWQILWNQTKRRVSWRNFSGDAPGRILQVDFARLDFACGRAVQTAPVQAPDGRQSSEEAHFVPCDGDCRRQTTFRIEQLFDRLGRRRSQDFTERLHRFIGADVCLSPDVGKRP